MPLKELSPRATELTPTHITELERLGYEVPIEAKYIDPYSAALLQPNRLIEVDGFFVDQKTGKKYVIGSAYKMRNIFYPNISEVVAGV